jgi:hypothetical protein
MPESKRAEDRGPERHAEGKEEAGLVVSNTLPESIGGRSITLYPR